MLLSAKNRLRRHRFWMTLLLLLGGIYVLASVPLCPHGKQAPPVVLLYQHSAAALEVGAAKAEILVPHWPVTVAGYGPVRANAVEQTLPLYARALVVKSGDLALSLLSLDVLLVSEAFVGEIRQHAGEVLVVPVHSHSSIGGFDARWQVQLAAMGRFDEAQYQAVLKACLQAIEEARQKLQPAQFAWEETTLENWTRPRSGDRVDARLLRLRWEGEHAPIAQIVVLSAHPTLVQASAAQLNPDFPGELALLEEKAGRGVTLVWPSAVANARVALPEATPQSFAQKLHEHLQALWPSNAEADLANPKETPKARQSAEHPAVPLEIHHARIRFALPAIDTSRLVPQLLRGPANNLLCQGIPAHAELSVLRLGDLPLVAVPFEVSAQAALALEEAGLGRTLSIANNYLGYLETPGNVEERAGESKLQYFDKTLLQQVIWAAQARPFEGVSKE